MYIHWKKELELGNDLIDTQHRMLILLCRKLDITIKTGQSIQTLRRVLMELKIFTKFHFVSEENLMREMGYPGADEHELIHMELLMQLEMKLAKLRAGKEFPEDLLYFLNSWLAKHVIEEDLKIAKFAEHSEKRPIGEDLYGQYLLSVKR